MTFILSVMRVDATVARQNAQMRLTIVMCGLVCRPSDLLTESLDFAREGSRPLPKQLSSLDIWVRCWQTCGSAVWQDQLPRGNP